jgi:hypothetical protein
VPPTVGGATTVELSGTVVEIGAGPVEAATVLRQKLRIK